MQLSRLAPLALLLCPCLAHAQTVTTLRPERYVLAIGEPVILRFDTAAQAPSPWPTGEIPWLFVRGAGTQENMHFPRPARDGATTLSLDGLTPGMTLIGADRAPRIESVRSDELARFLAERVGASALAEGTVLPAGEALVRVRRIESAKVLIRVVEGVALPSAVAQSKTGQRAELRPLADPTTLALGSDVPIRVYLPGAPEAGTLGIARNRTRGTKHTFVTRAGGIGFFRLDAPGEWTIEAHHARRLSDGADAPQWEITSAYLAFHVEAPADEEEG